MEKTRKKGQKIRRKETRRKGQMQMNESIIVLVIFFIILIIGISLFYKYNMKSIELNKIRYERDRVYSLLFSLPCSAFLQNSYFLNEEFSVDSSKLIGLKLGKLGRGIGFGESLGYKKILVREVYPQKKEGLCGAGNYPKCDTYILYDNEPRNKKGVSIVEISTPVPLYFHLTDLYRAGRLEITWYIL